jgi:hypothetical protein
VSSSATRSSSSTGQISSSLAATSAGVHQRLASIVTCSSSVWPAVSTSNAGTRTA